MPRTTHRMLLLLPKFPQMGLMSGPVYHRICEFLSARFDFRCSALGDPGSYGGPHLPIPFRQWWWPPPSVKMHTKLRVRYLQKQFSLGPQDQIIVSYPFPEMMKIAAELSKLSGARYHVLVHDHHRESLQKSEVIEALQGAASIQCVSEPLRRIMAGYNSEAHILYPTPGKEIGVDPEFSRLPLGLAGGFDQNYLNILSKFRKQARVIGDPLEAARNERMTFVERFAENDDAVRHVATHCSAFTVIVPRGHGDYALTSFPSKLIDFARCGLPIIICADPRSPVGMWAKENDWLLYIDDEDDQQQFDRVSAILDDPQGWQRAKSQVDRVRREQFGYDSINNRMLERLTA